MCICHHCDIGSCINVYHLFMGTRIDNNADMRAKKRDSPPPHLPRHQRKCAAKLTEQQVRSIRDDPRPQPVIAADYGIRQPTVSKIKLRQRWAHI